MINKNLDNKETKKLLFRSLGLVGLGIFLASLGTGAIFGGIKLIDGNWQYWPLLFTSSPRWLIAECFDGSWVDYVLFDFGTTLLVFGGVSCLASLFYIGFFGFTTITLLILLLAEWLSKGKEDEKWN